MSMMLRLLPRWLQPDKLGKFAEGKSLTPGHFGEASETTPVRSYAILRAWMLWRFKQKPGFQGSS
eukprot:3476952-Amphidinium_carterae.1